MSELIEYRITFGSIHPEQIGDRFPVAHMDGWLAVLAGDEVTARMATIGAIGRTWSFLYEPERWDPKTDDQFFPRGELGRIEATGRATAPDFIVDWRWVSGGPA